MIRKLTIAVPVFNEAERVERALKELLAVAFPVPTEILIVDDGSTDTTADTLSRTPLPENCRVLRHPVNRGKGAAIRTAIDEATGDAFVPFDADLEYDPEDLVKLLEPMARGEADVVYGTRAFGSHTAYNFWYVMGNKMLTLWANVLFNVYLSDLETCFKLVRTQILRDLHLRSNSFDIEPEITGKLLRAGFRPYEVAIQYRARTREQGKKISWRDGIRAILVIARIRFSRAA